MVKKVKLFIFSNTYTARVLLRCLEYITKKQDFELVLLSELCVSNNINITIHVYETLQQCVDACTQILVINNDTIPKSKINLVESLANFQNKRCTIVHGFNDAQNICTKNAHLNQSINEKPLIAIVSYGTQTQLSCWESIIYKLLIDNKFKVFLKPSEELNNVLKWLSLCDLENDLTNGIGVTEADCEVIVECLQYDPYNPNINNEVNKMLYQINPDVIIVSICNNFYNYDDIQNIFRFRYNRIIDIFAKSELLEMIDEDGNRKKIFDFSPLRSEKDSTVSLNDPLLIPHLSKVILPKIALPDGVAII